MPERHFTPTLFKFLRDLAANNDRAWFQDHHDRYLAELRDPCLAFITDFGAHLARISPHFRADPKPVGGSMFRIHRDVRFSKDKSPYKTAVGLHFRHEAGKTAHTPGFYLHLEPGACFVGVGIWRPDTATLGLIRAAMDADPEGWRQATRGPDFIGRFTVQGDRLKRIPRGYDADHPLADDLRLKDVTAFANLTRKRVTARGFVEGFAEDCRAGASLVAYVCRVLDQPF